MQESNIRSGLITAIEEQRRDPERVSVFIDGSFAFGINRMVAAEFGLSVGRRIEADELSTLQAAEEVSRALQAALQFLAYRGRSSVEVERRLARRGFSPDAIAATMSRLRDWRYVDDDFFARSWVENRLEHQPRGRRLLKRELREKGIDAAVVDRTLEEAEIDEYPAALALARKRAPSLAGGDPLAQRRRLAGFLQRRGYGWDVVRRVLDTVLGEDEDAGVDAGDTPE
jgi:regulatory protein